MASPMQRLGLVVHPTRDLEMPLAGLRTWCDGRGIELVQIPVRGQQQEVAPAGAVEDCDLVAAIGGDGTALAAIRAAAGTGRPVLGIACGSLGALTSVAASEVAQALERITEGDWLPQPLPALEISREPEDPLLAFNDIAVVRHGEGQVRSVASVDGVLFARLAGDGCIVSTQMGSSAYAFAAGGPLLASGAHAFLLTPLSNHGGRCPPLVIGAASELQVEVGTSFGGARLEVDGKISDTQVKALSVRLRPAAAVIAAFRNQPSFLTGLRQRGVIIDSPRILAEDKRAAS
jgi:NAD+ kinase